MQDLFSVSEKVLTTLEKLFQQHRLVFWYDDRAEMKELFESLQLGEIQKLVVQNNEFNIKYQVLVETPNQKYLIYQPKPMPANQDNWLLDLVLSHTVFNTDPSSLILQELNLPAEYKTFVQQHHGFFAAEKYLTELKPMLEPEDRLDKITLKMLSVICQCEVEWEKILYVLFAEATREKREKYQAIQKFALDGWFWETIGNKYGFRSPQKSVKELIVSLINDDFQRKIPNGKPALNKDALLFVSRWKENVKFNPIFSTWSKKLEPELMIESRIQPEDASNLLETDTFPVIDKKIIHDLKNHILKETLPNSAVQEWMSKRRTKYFFNEFVNLYEALNHASELLDAIRKADLRITTATEGFERYSRSLFSIDLLYRKYIGCSERAEHQNVLKDLTSLIEKAYENSFLLPLNDHWQAILDPLPEWKIDRITSLRQFHQKWIQPYLSRENRVFVIISDALRYESATELMERVLQIDRFTASLTSVLGALPSYTQLGMASMLPHTALTFNDGTDIVFANGLSTQGTANRTKVLQSFDSRSIAINAEDFLKMKAIPDGREFVKPYNAIYIYSNMIDKTGDDKTSESKVFEATEQEFDHILKMIRQINNMNGYNMIITSDHGYLYQHNRIEESDFTSFTASGDIFKLSRRFILGKNLSTHASVKKWTGKQLGFADDTEALIPKSINRLRLQGSGSRFVHGGSSLQEIVIPVLEINVTRKKDIEQVEIDVSAPSYNITSNSFGVGFYQKQPVGEKVMPRTLRVSFQTQEGHSISDIATLRFDSRDSNATGREQRKTFLFTSEASKLNGQDVNLVLEENVEDTTHFTIYKTISFRMLIAFSSEFDNF